MTNFKFKINKEKKIRKAESDLSGIYININENYNYLLLHIQILIINNFSSQKFKQTLNNKLYG